jgi:hypothetical protein
VHHALGSGAIDEAGVGDAAEAAAKISGDADQLSKIDARAASARAERAAANATGPSKPKPVEQTVSSSETPARSIAASSAPPNSAPPEGAEEGPAPSAPPPSAMPTQDAFGQSEQSVQSRPLTRSAPVSAASDASSGPMMAAGVRDFGDAPGVRTDAPSRQRFSNSTQSLASLIDRFSAESLSSLGGTASAGTPALASLPNDANLSKLLEQMAAFHGGAGLAEDLAQRGAARAGDFASLVAAGRGSESVSAWR